MSVFIAVRLGDSVEMLVHDFSGSGRFFTVDVNFNKVRDAYEKEIREQKEKERIAEIGQQRMASKAKYDKFIESNNVAAWPNIQDFYVNPFICKGEIIALHLRLNTFIEPEKAIFGHTPRDAVVVSGLRTEEFPREAEALIAGRVVGKEEIEVPTLGRIVIPHIEFGGAYICSKRDCLDVLSWRTDNPARNYGSE